MPRYSKTKINTLLKNSDQAPNTYLKGQIFEDLCIYIIEKIPGITLIDRNVKDPDVTEEIDLVLGNNQAISNLYILPPVFFCECKNEKQSLSTAKVSNFIYKLKNRNASAGIIFSTSNISGHKKGKKHSAKLVVDALKAHGIVIIVIDRKIINSLANTQDLIDIINQKYLNIYVRGTY